MGWMLPQHGDTSSASEVTTLWRYTNLFIIIIIIIIIKIKKDRKSVST